MSPSESARMLALARAGGRETGSGASLCLSLPRAFRGGLHVHSHHLRRAHAAARPTPRVQPTRSTHLFIVVYAYMCIHIYIYV